MMTIRRAGTAQTAAANAARQQATTAAMQRITDAITRLRREKTPVTFALVARRANVSRTFLYTNHDAHSQLRAAIGGPSQHSSAEAVPDDKRQESTWRQRALNAEDGLKAAQAEILKQRSHIGALMGQIRDLQAEWSDETVQNITSENTTLKQRVRQLTADNRTLEERLQAAAPRCGSKTGALPTWKPSYSTHAPRIRQRRKTSDTPKSIKCHARGERSTNRLARGIASCRDPIR